MGQRDTFEWIFHHHPPGLFLQSWGAVPWSATWGDKETRAYVSPRVDVEILPRGTKRSEIRVAADANWLTDSPAPVERSGPRLRITLDSDCPHALGNYKDVSNPRSRDLQHGLTYSGDPTAGTRCEYDNSGDLIQADRLGGQAATALGQAISQLILGSPGTYGHGCGAPVYGPEIIILHYPGEPDLDLWYDKTCWGFVDNGIITTSLYVPQL